MHAHDMCAGEDGRNVGGYGGSSPSFAQVQIFSLHWLHGFTEKALAREPDQQRPPQFAKATKASQQGEVLRAAFAEAEPRIDDDPFGADTACLCLRHLLAQSCEDARHDHAAVERR